MWADNEDFDADVDGEALAWDLALSRVALALLEAIGPYGHYPMPIVPPTAGYRWGVPRLDSDELVMLRLALGQAQLRRQHDAFIIWEVQQAGRI